MSVYVLVGCYAGLLSWQPVHVQVVNVRRMLCLPAMLEHLIILPSRLTADMQLNDAGDVMVYTAAYRKSDDLPLASVRAQAPL